MMSISHAHIGFFEDKKRFWSKFVEKKKKKTIVLHLKQSEHIA